jgi:hypothetical protein
VGAFCQSVSVITSILGRRGRGERGWGYSGTDAIVSNDVDGESSVLVGKLSELIFGEDAMGNVYGWGVFQVRNGGEVGSRDTRRDSTILLDWGGWS